MREPSLESLTTQSHDTLLEFIRRQRTLIHVLETRLAEQDRRIRTLEAENHRLREQLSPAEPRWAPWTRPPPKAHPMPPGQKPGHRGMTRATPTRVDRIVAQTLTACPQCHGRLAAPVAVTTHVQEDLIPARVEVTQFRRARYYCRACRRMVTAPPAPDEVPHSTLGPRVLTETLLLRYVHGLPFEKIQRRFQEAAGLTVSPGALAQALQRIARWLAVEDQALLEAIRASPTVHVDETGWTITGVNHWLWAFVTARLAAYAVDRSRGAGVPQAILGAAYPGVVVSDFHAAYTRLAGHQQKCWVHLLRDLHRAGQRDASAAYARARRTLHRIFTDARRLAAAPVAPDVRARRRAQLADRLWRWGQPGYPTAALRRLAARVQRFHPYLLTFLDVPGVPADNNAAERGIRPHVILRNRSYQSRSLRGAQTHAVLMGLVQTLERQGRSVGETLHEAYRRHRQGDLTPVVVSQS